LTEVGRFNASSGGVIGGRTVFDVVNVNAGEAISATYKTIYANA
jgi:hypothetical protein